MGKGLIRERRKAQSAKSLVATMDFLGMTDEQKKAFLEKVKAAMESKPDQLGEQHGT